MTLLGSGRWRKTSMPRNAVVPSPSPAVVVPSSAVVAASVVVPSPPSAVVAGPSVVMSSWAEVSAKEIVRVRTFTVTDVSTLEILQ